MGKINWKVFFLKVVSAAPDIWNAVEKIHQDSKDHATKLQIAADTTVAATGIAGEIDPADSQVLEIAGQIATSIIADHVANQQAAAQGGGAIGTASAVTQPTIPIVKK